MRSPTHVCAVPAVKSTETFDGAVEMPVTLNETFSGVPGVGPQAVASGMFPTPVPANVADGTAFEVVWMA